MNEQTKSFHCIAGVNTPGRIEDSSPAQLAFLALNGTYGEKLVASRLIEAIANSPIKSYGERYISEHGLAKAQERVNYLDNRIQQEFAGMTAKHRHWSVENLIDEAHNIRKAIHAHKPAEPAIHAFPKGRWTV